MYYINNFFLFSILGHLFETTFFVAFNVMEKSGFLYLWWTPFYGFGVLLSMLIYNVVNKYIKRKWLKNIILFFIFCITFSSFEYLGGFCLEKLYGYSFWDATDTPLHIGKYVSVLTSVLWATLAFIYLYYIKKYSDKLVNKIPKAITIILIITFITDCIVSLWKVLK